MLLTNSLDYCSSWAVAEQELFTEEATNIFLVETEHLIFDELAVLVLKDIRRSANHELVEAMDILIHLISVFA